MRQLALMLGVLTLIAALARADEDANPVPSIRMVHVEDGLRGVAPKGNLGLLRSTSIYKTAAAAGVDLAEPDHDLLVQKFADGRLFYVFYKTVEGAVGDRSYLIQRIKKTVRGWKTSSSPVEETVTYQVEVFRTNGGTLKAADQHYGSYGLRDWYRREIIKEYELGFGEIPGVCEGTSWPYPAKTLYRLLQSYDPGLGHFDDVEFTAAKAWTLHVALGRNGDYFVRSPELGFDAPKTLPTRTDHAAKRDPRSARWVLTAGQGVGDLYVGESRGDDVAAVLGTPREVRSFKTGAQNHETAVGLTVNVDASGVVNTVFTRSEFAGATSRGIRLGSSRVDVMRAYGVPRRQQTDGPHWTYPGMVFYFDGWHEVTRIVVAKMPR